MRKRISFIVSICFVVFLFAGCVIKKRPLETLGLATAIGVDKGEENKIKGTLVMHHFGSKPEDVAAQLESTANTSQGLFKFMNLETSDKLVTGQLRVAVYGKSYAKEEGIISQVQTLKRDAATQTNMYLAISETTAKDILFQTKAEEHSKNMGTYLYKMIQQNIDGESVISCTVQEFLRDYLQVGKDPVLPLLEKRRDFVLIDGAALMFRGKYITDINAAETFYVKAIRDGYKGSGQTDIELPNSAMKKFYTEKAAPGPLFVNLQQIKAKRKVKLVKQKDPVFDVDVQVTANIAALSQPVSLEKPGVYAAFEKAISAKMEKELAKEIKKMQKYKVDPMGFGVVYDTTIRHLTLTEKEWYQNLYPKAKFRIHVKTKIARSGVLN